MWRSQIPASKTAQKQVVQEADDWDTDPDFVNSVTEKEQRYGSKTVEGSGIVASQNLSDLRETVMHNDAEKKKEKFHQFAGGYGGSFGVQTDRMDKSAVGNEYKADVEKHSSQKDYNKGFGGKYGVQADRQDKSAETFAYKGTTEKHSSQQDYSRGFGGKFGVEHDRKDAAAEGFDYKANTEKHSSQNEYKQGYGGVHGVQTDRQDKSAVGWSHREQTEKHSSQKDYSKGFGGKFGVEADRQDKSAAGWEKPADDTKKVTRQVEGPAVEERSESATSIKAKFESLAKSKPAEPAAPAPRPQPGKLGKWQPKPIEKEEAPAPEAPKDIRSNGSNGTAKNGHLPAADRHENGSAAHEEAQQPANGNGHHVVEDSPPAVPQPGEDERSTRTTGLFSEEDVSDSADYGGNHNETEDLGHQFAQQAAVSEHHAYEEDQQQYESAPSHEIAADEGAQSAPESNVTATVQFDYETTASDELPLTAGALVTNIQMVDEGWWYGTSNGLSGLFPANYVELNQ